MDCCRRDDDEGVEATEYLPGKTYRFVPPLRLRLIQSLAISLAAAFILTFFLYVPRPVLSLPVPVVIGLTIGVSLFCFLMLALPHVSGTTARFVEVSPEGFIVERRNGTCDRVPWRRVRGYVYDGVRYVFLVPGGSVEVKILGLSPAETALLRRAMRAPLEHGSLQWRGVAGRPLPRSARLPRVVFLAGLVLGGALVYLGQRVLGVGVVIGTLAYLFHRRAGPPRAGESASLSPPPDGREK